MFLARPISFESANQKQSKLTNFRARRDALFPFGLEQAFGSIT